MVAIASRHVNLPVSARIPINLSTPQLSSQPIQLQNTLRVHRVKGLVTLRDLALLNRREFKVHGGYIGDNSDDISYSKICKQIDEGLKEQYTEREII